MELSILSYNPASIPAIPARLRLRVKSCTYDTPTLSCAPCILETDGTGETICAGPCDEDPSRCKSCYEQGKRSCYSFPSGFQPTIEVFQTLVSTYARISEWTATQDLNQLWGSGIIPPAIKPPPGPRGWNVPHFKDLMKACFDEMHRTSIPEGSGYYYDSIPGLSFIRNEYVDKWGFTRRDMILVWLALRAAIQCIRREMEIAHVVCATAPISEETIHAWYRYCVDHVDTDPTLVSWPEHTELEEGQALRRWPVPGGYMAPFEHIVRLTGVLGAETASSCSSASETSDLGSYAGTDDEGGVQLGSEVDGPSPCDVQ